MKIPPKVKKIFHLIELLCLTMNLGIAMLFMFCMMVVYLPLKQYQSFVSLVVCMGGWFFWRKYLLPSWILRHTRKILVVGVLHNAHPKPGRETMICPDIGTALINAEKFKPQVVYVSVVFTLILDQQRIYDIFEAFGAFIYFYNPDQNLPMGFDYLPTSV